MPRPNDSPPNRLTPPTDCESCPAPLLGTAALRFRAAQADNLLKAIIMAWFEASSLKLRVVVIYWPFVGKQVCPRTASRPGTCER